MIVTARTASGRGLMTSPFLRPLPFVRQRAGTHPFAAIAITVTVAHGHDSCSDITAAITPALVAHSRSIGTTNSRKISIYVYINVARGPAASPAA